MKNFILLLLLIFVIISASAQPATLDSLKKELITAKHDTNRVLLLAAVSHQYLYSRPDSALLFAQQGYDLAQELNFPKGEALCLNRMANSNVSMGNTPKALQLFQKARTISEKINDLIGVGRSLNNIANMYSDQGDNAKALPYLLQAKKINEIVQNPFFLSIVLQNLGECYFNLNKLDSAWLYTQSAYKLSQQLQDQAQIGDIYRILGDIQAKKGQYAPALVYYQESIASLNKVNDIQHISITYLSIAKLYQVKGQTDSVVYYAKKALEKAQSGTFTKDILNASQLLSQVYENKNQYANAFRYFKIATAAKDSLFSQEKVKQLLTLGFEEKMKQQEIEAANNRYRDRIKIYILLGGLVALLLVAVILIHNNKQRQKAYTLLQKQKRETDTQKAKAEQALQELKVTQSKLIQAEKMASLGELTAGVAHEIQNPMNFVNNFSEVSLELCQELQHELSKVDILPADRENLKEIVTDLAQNQEKIYHHGQRADSIVKGMLQHSRPASGEKQLTDLNALADEYLRLAYHGLRAKDKSFNANLITDFDKELGKIALVPQEIGRVLLNLFNNAFYATQQKKNQLNGQYEPEVKVTTCREGGRVEIKIRDNGSGIPEQVKSKIFQPFFTTKPAGQGTGLGLSLSYDIITNGHGGELKVETEEGEFTEFSIQLSVT